ncbi:hypothetical protein BDV12DRAFT_198213 [Aspergillus spectabilis]
MRTSVPQMIYNALPVLGAAGSAPPSFQEGQRLVIQQLTTLTILHISQSRYFWIIGTGRQGIQGPFRITILTPAKQISRGTLAEAFFRNDLDLNYLDVYHAAFEPGAVQYPKNIFLHELGHVGPRDPTSVMAYEFPPQIQDTDIKNTQVFYKFPGDRLGVYQHGEELPLRIVDYDANN